MTVKPRPPIDRCSKTPTPNHGNELNSSFDSNSSQEIEDSKSFYQKESCPTFCERDQQQKSYGVCVLLVILTIIIGIIWLQLAKGNQSIKTCSFADFETKYHQKENAWFSLSVGIENIINGRRDAPAVYLFLHNEDLPFKKIVKEVALRASSCFGDKKRPVQMDTSDFTSNEVLEDYGHVIEKYRNKIQEGNVILIVNLNEIPAEAASALHTICDTVNPIVKNVVILMTLNSQEGFDNAVVAAENALNKLWGSKLKSSTLDPLVTRIVDQVIALK